MLMKTNFTCRQVVFFAVMCLTFFSCKKKDPVEDSQVLYLRVVNETDYEGVEGNLLAGPISVKATANTSDINFEGEAYNADFGTIAVGETSEYKPVSGVFLLTVNGEPFHDGFGISAPPSTKWTLKIRGIQELAGDFHYVWSLNADF